MHSNHVARRRFSLAVAGCLLAGRVLAQSDYDPDWSQHFRIGAIGGFNIKTTFRLQGNLNTGHGPGVFDDGYVHPPPAGTADSYTPNWGYNNASQVSGQTLTMTDTTSFTLNNGASEQKDAGPLAGFEMAYGGNLWYWNRFRFGWDAGVGILPINVTVNESGLPGFSAQNTYTYNTGGIQMPPAGYRGGNGGQWNIDSQATSTNSATPAGLLSGSQTLDVILYTARLGPTVYWDMNSYVGFSASLGPAIGVVNGKLKWNETITTVSTGGTAQMTGQVNGTDVVYGGYVNAQVYWHVVKNGDLYLGAQFMPLTTATISGGGHQAELNFRGQVSVSGGFNWPF
ncbi:MAG: hypothetical protein U1F98_09170 [Verrucomicrobiota bacterium]